MTDEAKNAEEELISLIEDGIKSITLCETEDESSYTILDAIADTLGDNDIKRASEMVGDHAAYIATALLSAGYAKREDVLEEGVQALRGCAYDLGFDPVLGPGGCLLEGEGQRGCVCMGVASAIRSLKGQS